MAQRPAHSFFTRTLSPSIRILTASLDCKLPQLLPPFLSNFRLGRTIYLPGTPTFRTFVIPSYYRSIPKCPRVKEHLHDRSYHRHRETPTSRRDLDVGRPLWFSPSFADQQQYLSKKQCSHEAVVLIISPLITRTTNDPCLHRPRSSSGSKETSCCLADYSS
jgi:hypothetical protein